MTHKNDTDEKDTKTEEAMPDGKQVKQDDSCICENCKCGEEAKALQDQIRRTLADYQNLEKRIAGERREIILSANKQLLLQLLPVLDTLMMAARHVDDQGLKLSISQFLDTLKAEGVIRIDTKNKSFDPSLMEVVSAEEGENDKVLQETRAGFMLYDKILRPAGVIVGKKVQS